MRREDVERIAQLANGLGALLEDQILRWWEFRNRIENNPHDPLNALSMVRPDLFRFENWDVKVCCEGRASAVTQISNPATGAVQLGSDVLVRSAEKEIISRIVAWRLSCCRPT
jgi:purine nucleosidase